MIRPLLFACLLLVGSPAIAQENRVVSKCMAIAQSVPGITYANFTPGWQPVATANEAVTITYAGHSTYLIETPAGVRIATDFSGVYGSEFNPRVVTMNKAHRTHYTDHPPQGIEYVLRGWNPAGGPAHHALTVDDVTIRNVPTDIRHGAAMEKDGNSIFIFEVAGLCIGHLGHLHHRLDNAHYGAIGRLDIVMVPIDGGMTLSVQAMSDITTRLYSSMILPMHRHATPLSVFTRLMGDGFAVDFRSTDTLSVSLKTLPDRPTIVILSGV
ncbi:MULTISPECIES: MBL fold metallo-hydrolase [Mesorhizobium]|uniref:Zn-dependent hydrolase n=1 Tax=Mesorhizobium denitrificans TaxID=2294114 RepID=A0A371XFI8_9HYPH|nr:MULTISPECIES: MBL fold metallo-hydrolase [Mesorhizobium]RFC67988.1 Zn-dependent hydrolase [Mesorhizobium denitrificans]